MGLYQTKMCLDSKGDHQQNRDTWTKLKEGGINGRKRGWLGWGGVMGAKQRQLYLKNNKKCGKK